MKNPTVLQPVASALAGLGVNAIPLGLVVFGGQSPQIALALYLLETFLLVVLSALRVQIMAPLEDPAYETMDSTVRETETRTRGHVTRSVAPRNRTTLIGNYLIVAMGFTLVLAVFVVAFVFLFGQTEIPGPVLLAGLAGIVAFQAFSFVADLLLIRRLSPDRIDPLLDRSMSRVYLLYTAVFVGFFVALFSRVELFVVPFIILKTTADVAVPVSALAGRRRGRSH